MEKQEAEERQAEIIQFNRLLAQYGISFSELVEASNQHKETRLSAISVARIIAGNIHFQTYLLEKKALPIKQLEKETIVSRKTLNQQRKYIIAVALILIGEFQYLKGYVELFATKT